MVGDEQVGAVEDIVKMNEAFVGDGPDPVERDSTPGIVEDDFGVCSIALFLSCILDTPVGWDIP